MQFGGQTPLRLAKTLEDAGVKLLGTPVDAIDLAEDRGRFGAMLERLGIAHPPDGTALSAAEAEVIAAEVGFPLLVRPSYVLGGRAMEICYSTDDLTAYLTSTRRPAASTRCCSTASSRTRSRSTSTLSPTGSTACSPGSCSTSRRPASTRATRPASCRR